MEVLAVFPSLLAFLFVGLMGRKLSDKGAQFVTCAAVLLAAFVSCVLFFDVIIGNDPRTLTLASWITSGDFAVNWAIKVDLLHTATNIPEDLPSWKQYPYLFRRSPSPLLEELSAQPKISSVSFALKIKQ